MPQTAHPEAGNKFFPQSKGWFQKPWHKVIQYHVSNHKRVGADTLMGFDDDDRLCVLERGPRGYAVRVPKALVDWTEQLMAEKGVNPVPNHSGQLRFARGKGGSLMSDDFLPDREQIVSVIAREMDIRPDSLWSLFNGDMVNLEFGTGIPVKMEEIPNGSGNKAIAFGYVEKEGDTWMVHHGLIERTQDGGAHAERSFASGNIRQTRAGTVHRWVSDKVDQRVADCAAINGLLGDPGENKYCTSLDA